MNLQTTFHALFFDLDGTLVDSRQDIIYSINLTLKQLGLLPLEGKEILSFVGKGIPILIEKCINASISRGKFHYSNLVNFDKAVQVYRKNYSDHLLDSTDMYPHVRDVLDSLPPIPKVVITNKEHLFTERILNDLGLLHYFSRIIAPDNFPYKKPDPRVIRETARLLRVKCDITLALVGDSTGDIKTALNAGVTPIGVTYGFQSSQKLKEAGAQILISEFKELLKFKYSIPEKR
jgi:phosphoglycolate phosphatase